MGAMRVYERANVRMGIAIPPLFMEEERLAYGQGRASNAVSHHTS